MTLRPVKRGGGGGGGRKGTRGRKPGRIDAEKSTGGGRIEVGVRGSEIPKVAAAGKNEEPLRTISSYSTARGRNNVGNQR